MSEFPTQNAIEIESRRYSGNYFTNHNPVTIDDIQSIYNKNTVSESQVDEDLNKKFDRVLSPNNSVAEAKQMRDYEQNCEKAKYVECLGGYIEAVRRNMCARAV